MENVILQSTKEMYDLLTSTYKINIKRNEAGEITLTDLIKIMFNVVEGEVTIQNKAETFGYYSFDGSVNDYIINGSILMKFIGSSFYWLIEDLTMGYYKKIGGRDYASKSNLIKAIKKL